MARFVAALDVACKCLRIKTNLGGDAFAFRNRWQRI